METADILKITMGFEWLVLVTFFELAFVFLIAKKDIDSGASMLFIVVLNFLLNLMFFIAGSLWLAALVLSLLFVSTIYKLINTLLCEKFQQIKKY